MELISLRCLVYWLALSARYVRQPDISDTTNVSELLGEIQRRGDNVVDRACELLKAEKGYAYDRGDQEEVNRLHNMLTTLSGGC